MLWLGIWEGHRSLYGPRSGAVALSTMEGAHYGGGLFHHDDVVADLQSWEEIALSARRAPLFDKLDRRYLLATSPSSAICQLGGPPLSVTPSLVWPEDRAWFVGTEIDFDSTVIATSEQGADALLADPRIEAVAVDASDRLDDYGDTFNDARG